MMKYTGDRDLLSESSYFEQNEATSFFPSLSSSGHQLNSGTMVPKKDEKRACRQA